LLKAIAKALIVLERLNDVKKDDRDKLKREKIVEGKVTLEWAFAQLVRRVLDQDHQPHNEPIELYLEDVANEEVHRVGYYCWQVEHVVFVGIERVKDLEVELSAAIKDVGEYDY